MSNFQPVMGAVIGALTGSDDKDEVQVMAKQATEVLCLVLLKTCEFKLTDSSMFYLLITELLFSKKLPCR